MTTTSRGRQFTYNVININYMENKIGERTTGDSHCWNFEEVVDDR